ncbi:MAG: GNAT family N-acetyltransferase [Hyphococcus sp.]|nr:MAG: GNAT family N-acetyltransferase [Marinicaulis sp.]
MIRPATPDDKGDLLNLAVATGLFAPDELDELGGMLSEYFDGNLGDDHFWIVDDENGMQGAAYYAPEMMADGTWNLYFIGVEPGNQGKGRGASMLRHVEGALKARGERLLLVETSGLDNFDLTRKFYRKNGYDEEARIRDFYKAGDDKVVFRKGL